MSDTSENCCENVLDETERLTNSTIENGCETVSELSINPSHESLSSSESSCSSSGRISPTLFLPEARVRVNTTSQEKKPKKKEKKKLKLQEMDPEDLMLRASAKGRFDLVEYSLNKNSEIHKCHDEDLYTPLHRASYSGHVNIVQLLIDRGADVRARTIDGWEPIHSACRWGEI